MLTSNCGPARWYLTLGTVGVISVERMVGEEIGKQSRSPEFVDKVVVSLDFTYTHT